MLYSSSKARVWLYVCSAVPLYPFCPLYSGFSTDTPKKAEIYPALSVKYTDLVRVYEVDKSPKMSVARILGGLYYITEGVRWADWKFSIKLSEHVRA
jgi:hypothetical protein